MGFHLQDAEEPEKKEQQQEPSVMECILDAYFLRNRDSGRFTSQDICDNGEPMVIPASHLERDDDRLVWVNGIL